VDSFQFDQDGARAVFVVRKASNQEIELFVAPLDASAAAVRLNDPPPSGGSLVGAPHVLVQGSHVYYVGREAADPTRDELYRVPLAGGVLPTKISTRFVGGSSPLFGLVDGAKGVVYRSDEETPGATELYQATFPPSKVDRGRVPPF
jgi:hypothetical protein